MIEVEKKMFRKLKTIFQLEDPFPDANQLHFSRDSKRRYGSWMMAWIDRMYLFLVPRNITRVSL